MFAALEVKKMFDISCNQIIIGLMVMYWNHNILLNFKMYYSENSIKGISCFDCTVLKKFKKCRF